MYMSPPQLFSRANAMRSLFVHSTSRHLATSSTTTSTPVLISGAGPVGLTLSLLLARQGVPSTVIERRPYLCGEEDQANLRPSNPSDPSSPPLPPSHPRAHVLNARTMEIFRSMGLEEKVRALAPPDHQWDNFRYCQSLIGDDYAVDRHTLKGNERYENLIKHTPSFITHVSQPKLESLLLEEVRAVGSDMIDLQINTQVIDFIESEESSSGRVRSTDIVLRNGDDEDDDQKKKETNKMNCFYFVGCDGAGSLVRDKLNIPLHGDHALERFASVHFTSPHLASLMGGSTRSSMLYFVMNPKIISCVVGHDLKEGSFVAQVPVFPPFSASTGDESSSDWQLWCENAVDACIGTSGLERTIHSSRVWSMDSLCADTFHNEKNINIFLVGDSAHQLPPSGGFGLNTGIQDAHNLSWKMACAYKEGREGRRWRNGDDNVENEEEDVSKSETKMKGLLQTYTSERKPVALANMRVSNDNYKRGLEAPASIGLSRDLIAVASSALDNSSPVASLLPLSIRAGLLDMGATLGRSLLLGAPTVQFATNRISQVVNNGLSLPLLFPSHDLGYRYVPEGVENSRTTTSKENVLYTPSAAIGCRLPHVWLRKRVPVVESEEVVSSIDLVDIEKYVLLMADEDSFEKQKEEEEVEEYEKMQRRKYILPRETIIIRASEYEAVDGEGDWKTLWGVGALLVRPDGHVAELISR